MVSIHRKIWTKNDRRRKTTSFQLFNQIQVALPPCALPLALASRYACRKMANEEGVSSVLLVLLLLCVLMTGQVLAQAEKEEGEKGLISFGGQVRFRFDATQNQSLEDLGYTPGKGGESQLLNRTRLHVEANPSDWVRLYFEPQFYGRWGGYNNEDRLSVYQGYVEFPKLGQLPVNVSVGR